MGDWTVDGNLFVNGGIDAPTTTDIVADAEAQENYTIKIYRCQYTSYTGTLPAEFQYGFFLVFKRSIGEQIPNGCTIVAINYQSKIAIRNNVYGLWGEWKLFYSVDTAYITDTHSSGSVSIAANNHATVNITIGKTGYTPVGIIGVTWTGSSWPSLAGFQMTSSTNVALYVVNPTSSAMSSVTKYTVTILYRKV